jgi:hypothetical protein
VVLVCLLWPALAVGQGVDDASRRAARNLGGTGVEAYNAGDYAKASEKLDKAYQVLKVPSLGLWSARALLKLNRPVEAAERYQEVGRLEVASGDVEVQRQAKVEAAAELERLAPQIPNIVVRIGGNVEPSDVAVTIDGVPLASALLGEERPVNPGEHRVEARRGGEKASAVVVVGMGETKPVTLTFTTGSAASKRAPNTAGSPAPQADAPSASAGSGSAQRTIGFVALGVGGAGLVLGGVAAGIAAGKRISLEESGNCMGTQCLRSEQSLVDSYSTWRTISSVGLIGGAALAATGLVLVLATPSSQREVAVRVRPSSLEVSTTF